MSNPISSLLIVYLQKKIKKFQIPIIAVNNADFTKNLFFNFKNKPLSIHAQFYFIEYLDYLYHQNFPDLVIITLFEKYDQSISRSKNVNIIKVGPIFKKILNMSNKKRINLIVYLFIWFCF